MATICVFLAKPFVTSDNKDRETFNNSVNFYVNYFIPVKLFFRSSMLLFA